MLQLLLGGLLLVCCCFAVVLLLVCCWSAAGLLLVSCDDVTGQLRNGFSTVWTKALDRLQPSASIKACLAATGLQNGGAPKIPRKLTESDAEGSSCGRRITDVCSHGYFVVLEFGPWLVC